MKPAFLVVTAGAFLSGCILSGYGYTAKDQNGLDLNHPKYPPPMFEDYVAFTAKESSDYPITKIPTSLRIDAPVKIQDQGIHNNFSLSRLDASKICIQFPVSSEPREKTGQMIADAWLIMFNERSTAFRGITSFTTEKGRALFPVPDGASQITEATSISDEIVDVDNKARGTVDRVRVVTVQACAPRPAITDATRFIALTYHIPEASKPDYESENDGHEKRDEAATRRNTIERLKADQLILIAITDGAVDLTK